MSELGNGAATQDRFAGQSGYRDRAGRRDSGAVTGDPLSDTDLTPRTDLMPRNGVLAPGRPSLTDLDSLAEPVFPSGPWLESPTGELADHPLLRGLLMELPAKASPPPQEWLDRWFEAARSILELLYLSEPARR